MSHASPGRLAARCLVALCRAVLGWAACLLLAGPAGADGYYMAFDYSRTQPQGVLSVDRGRFTYAAAVGRGTDDRIWAKAAVMRVWTRGAVRLKLGSSVYAVEKEAWRLHRPEEMGQPPFDHALGVRLGADSYVDRGPWASYWMAEYDTTQNALLLLASGESKSTGLGAELSVWHEAGERASPTAMARWTPKDRDIALRAGWRFKDHEAFVGISVSRF